MYYVYMCCAQYYCQFLFFKVVTNRKFDGGIMIVILGNMFAMAIEHDDQSDEIKHILEYVNQVFLAIFTLECAIKLFALRHYYFREPWNCFDFAVVTVSIISTSLFVGYIALVGFLSLPTQSKL